MCFEAGSAAVLQQNSFCLHFSDISQLYYVKVASGVLLLVEPTFELVYSVQEDKRDTIPNTTGKHCSVSSLGKAVTPAIF